jgi:uncharacterized repeat protein (TIGR04002 family)
MNKTKAMSLAALFAAMTTVIIIFVRVPNPAGQGIIHVGDSVIYLAACILPFPFGLVAAAIGGSTANLIGGPQMYAPVTFVLKALITLPFTAASERILTKRNALALIPAGIITIGGYFLVTWFFFGRLTAIAWLPGGAVQVAASSAVFAALAVALDKSGFKKRV